MYRPEGEITWPMVMCSTSPDDRMKFDCISAFPKLRRPMIKARSWSWSDAAVASAALAESPFTKTISGRSRKSPSRRVR